MNITISINPKPILKQLNSCLMPGEKKITIEELAQCQDILAECIESGLYYGNKEGGITDEILRKFNRSKCER